MKYYIMVGNLIQEDKIERRILIMNNLALIKSENFGTVQCDFWQNEQGDILMTREQIGTALEYAEPRIAIANIHNRNKNRLDKFSAVINLITPQGTRQETTVYKHKGIYEICRFSRQPKADAFMDWVWDVVETIRKHGAYMTPEVIEKTLTNPDFIIHLATKLKEEQEARLEAEKQIEQQKPKVLFADAVTTSETSILVGELAKILKQNGIDTGQNRLFDWLRDNGYLIKRKGSDYNMPTQRSMDLGLFEIKETTITHSDGRISISKTPKVTGKGQLYFINKFREEFNTMKVGATI